MAETKNRKKMYKSGKLWVTAGLTALAIGATVAEPEFIDSITKQGHHAFAAQTTSSATIDTVTDAENGDRFVEWGAAKIAENDAYAGKGKYGSSTWSAEASSYNDPTGTPYSKLTANTQNTIGYNYVNRQFDASKKFTIDGYFHPNQANTDGNLPSNGTWSDWLGLVLTPTDPNSMATDYNMENGGGGLGIQGLNNAFALGLDFYQNAGDPAAGPFGALRMTNSTGALQSVPEKLYTKGLTLTNWRTTVKYQLTWYPTGGPEGGPYITASLTPTSGGTIWNVNTNQAGIKITPPKAFSVSTNAANGDKANDNFASMNNLSGTLATGTTTVNYVDANGKTIKPATTFIANVGDIVGITNTSPQAKAGTADYAYAAPTIRGYTLSSANDVTVSQTGSKNVLTIKYTEKPTQQANITTNMPSLWSGSSTIASYTTKDQDKPLGNTSLAASIDDASLARSGYTYAVIGPNSSAYSTMSAAYVATTNVWDSTANSVGAADSSPQTWQVSYVANYQAAYLYLRDYSYANGTYSEGSASYKTGAGGYTNQSISFSNISDGILPKSGYTYTVTGPDGVAYSTLASALSANPFDKTNNPSQEDSSAQRFYVNYYPTVQTTSLVVDVNSPVNAGSVLASSAGATSATLAIPYTDTSLSMQGYSYSVKGPNGSTYTTLSSAVAANATYDATTNSGSTDASAQVFTVSYAPHYQSAAIKYAADGPISAGSTLASTSGMTNGTMSFAVSDGDLARFGYTYTVAAPNGSVYAGSNALSAAVLATKFDNTANSGSTDTSAQVFTVTYKVNQQASLYTVSSDTAGNSVIGYSAVNEIVNGQPSSAIAFSTTDSNLERSGYTYVVNVLNNVGSVLQSYTTLTSAVAAQKYDNTSNAANATTDAQVQRFQVVYAPQKATVTYKFIDQNGKEIKEATSATGNVGSKIPNGAQDISGYTLVGPDTNSDSDGIFDADLVSVITYVYQAQYQAARVVVDSQSPTAAGSAVTSASGVTSGSIAFDSVDLAKTGYTTVVYGPNGSSYSTLSQAVAANSLYDNTSNAGASSDASAQLFRVSYVAAPQSAQIRVTQNSPIKTGSFFDTVTGVTSGTMSFKTTDADMATSGYTYQVGYGYDASHITWYSNLSSALAAHPIFDDTNNASATDTKAQFFYVSYAPMSQAALVTIDASSPISAGSTAMSANGTTGSAISFASDASYATLDSQLTKSGYTYTVRYGSDATTYTTLSSAMSAHSLYNSNNTVSGTSDATPDTFTVSYKANSQVAVLAVTSDSPVASGSIAASASGVTSGSLGFSMTDENLARAGYTYTVTGPNGSVYSNLASALAQNSVFDNTNNPGLSDSAVQRFLVSYKADYQEARVIVDSGVLMSTSSVAAVASGVTAGTISFSITDSQLSVAGYHYKIYNDRGASYATLSSAMAVTANNRFNTTANGSATSDRVVQNLWVVYTADSQIANIMVADNSPISAGTAVDTASGATRESLTFADTSDGDLDVSGYHYTVTGPDGTEYSDLASALAGNSLYDNTTNTGTNDASAQNFTVNYTADTQWASLAVTDDSPINAGSVIGTVSGVTAGTIPFDKDDADLILSGYTYRVMGPDGEWYDTLAAAESNNTTFDNTINASDSDDEPQVFLVSYTAMSQAATIVGAADSPISAGLAIDSASGVTSQAIGFTKTDTTLTQSGYSYVVYMGADSATSYSTLSAAMAANSLYNNTNTTDGSDADPQVFTVSYIANYQSANLVIGGDTQISSGVTLDSAAGVTSGRIAFATTDAQLDKDGYRYTVKAPNGTTYETLTSALAGSHGLYDNTTNTDATDASAQTFTVEYEAITQTAEVVVAETSDKYSGQLLAKVTGDTGAELGFTYTDADLANDEMSHGYTYTVTVQNADGSWVTDASGSPVQYATLNEAIAANNTFDAVDTGIKKFVINPVASYQEGQLVVTSNSPISAGAAIETASGVTDAAMSYATTDTDLAQSGYTYTVTVTTSDGTKQTYATLSAAVSAVSIYDSTINGSGTADSSAQVFEVSYKADYQSANIAFATTDGDTPMSAVALAGVTSSAYTATYSAAEGYYFTADNQPSGVSITADGRSATVTFAYDNTNNKNATDSSAQNFTLMLAEAAQSGEISYSYSNAVGSPTVPSAVAITGVTGENKSGTLIAPDGYYIVSVEGESYTVTFTDDTHQEATYTLTLDYTGNGNETTDQSPQDLLVILAPTNQTANVTEVMPDGASQVVDTQNDRTGDSYAYDYTAPAGYYVASDSVTPATGVTASIASDGKKVTLEGTYDDSKTTDAVGTDAQTQDTTITLSKSTQLAEFRVLVPTWPTTVTSKMNTVEGPTGSVITAPDGYSDEELTMAGYTYTIKGPDGKVYNTMAEALDNNATFDSSDNGSGSDTETQKFEITYVALDQTATITQQYAAGATNTPAFPQANQELNGKTEQQVSGTINAPTGYEISNITDTPGMTWTIADDKLSATYTLTYDTTTDESTISQAAVVTYAPLEQTVNVSFKDEVGRDLMSDTKVTGHDLKGVTNEAVNYSDAGLLADKVIDGYTITSQNEASAVNYDNDTAMNQSVVYVYRDTQAPTITTTKDELVTAKSDLPADEASFLQAVGFETADNQQHGESTTTSDYADVAALVQKDGVARDVTITVVDATDNKTTKTVRLTVLDTAPVSQETAVQEAATALNELAVNPDATADQVAEAKQALADAISEATTARDEAKQVANDVMNSSDAQAVASDENVAEAKQALENAIAAADEDTGSTQTITDATAALENAIARAEAVAVDTAPVSNETAVQDAQKALDDLLADETTSTEAIDSAKQALQDAVSEATEARNVANAAADETEAQVVNSKDAAVKQAVADLNAIQDQAADDQATTAAIDDARQAVADAVKDAAQAALDQDASPVQNESDVSRAKDNLQAILNNPSSTLDQIVDATNAYNDAITDAKNARDEANQAATDEIAAADRSNQANDQSVIDAKNALQDLLDKAANGDADALTDDIEKATEALKDAVSEAGGAQELARKDAAAALAKTSPVSHESDVQEKIDALNDLLADPTTTADQISDATKQLTDAVSTANTQRETANRAADTAIANAQQSNQADEPAVQAAEKALQDLVDAAKGDSADALTADINEAIKNLQNAVSDAASSQSDARQAAQDAINAVSPVSYESDTATALQNLQDVLNNPASTTAEIQDATDALIEATANDKSDRDETNRQANAAVSAAQTGNQATEPGVLGAIQHLKDVQAAAAADSSNALTSDIQDALDALQQAQADASQNQDSARQDAVAAIAETQPVSNEATVLNAREALDALLDDASSSTADIEKATQALRDANAAEQTKRTDINRDADAYEDVVTQSNQKDEPTVVAALQALQELQDEAATDVPDALTADIAAALDALHTAVNQAAATQSEARDNAADAMKALNPVSHEAGVSTAAQALTDLLNNPAATTEDIKDATQRLLNETSDAKGNRTDANTDAQNAITDATNSDQSTEPAVQDALENLKQVMDEAATDSSNALTADIDAARKALEQAVADAQAGQEQARNDATTALSQTQPVSYEVATAQARNALEAVLNNPAATAADIQTAVTTLTEAATVDKQDRENANAQGTQAIADAQSSSTAAEPAVVSAVRQLQEIMHNATTDIAGALTKDILNAIQSLADAQAMAAEAQDTARQEATDALATTAPISNEAVVADAISNLNDVLNDPQATTEAIDKATQALRDAVAETQPARDAANQAADDVVDAVPSDLKDEPSVAAAVEALKKVQDAAAADDANNLTSDIEAATKVLQDAVTAAADSRETARNAADELIGKTAPVSNEATVATAKDALQTLLDDPTSTTADIENATAALRDALQPVGADRTQANDDANSLMDVVKPSAAGQDATVQEALQKLQDVMDKAASDSADALTSDIEAATKALHDAVSDANDAIADARDAANELMGKTAPVSHETEVADATTALQKVLDDPDASQTQIMDATQQLQTALDTAKSQRDAANTAADKAIADVQDSSVVNEPSVQTAVDHLRAVMEAAANDSATNLTADIQAAIDALHDAETAATNNQQTARDAATDALSKTAPVSNEPGVADAISDLQKVLEDPTSTSEAIADATQTLQDEVAMAETARDDANAAADTEKSAVPSELAKEPSVQAAQDALNEIQKQAAADTAGNLTKDIEAATKTLQDAITTADTSREVARDAADELMGKTAPVSHETTVATAKDALKKLLDDPTSTTADIENATAALRDALQPVVDARTQANDTAQSLIDSVKPSAAGQVPAVQEALQKLQDVMNQAAGDNADALTADIEAATNALHEAVAAADSDIADARNAANDALGKTAPVSHEAEVATAITDLQKVLDDPNASAEQITAATTALQTAVADANSKRDDANAAADKAIATAERSSVVSDPAVQAALDHLQAVLEAAAKDSASDLTSDIEAAIKALQTAVTEAEARNAVVPPVEQPTIQPVVASAPVYSAAYVATPEAVPGQTQKVYSLAYASEPGRIGTLPYTGYNDDWRLMALGIFLFSSTLLLLAAKRRKKDEDD